MYVDDWCDILLVPLPWHQYRDILASIGIIACVSIKIMAFISWNKSVF